MEGSAPPRHIGVGAWGTSISETTIPDFARQRGYNAVEEIQWYHEFDFPNGIQARAKTRDVEFHRRLWRFIEAQLDKIDFRGKSVLDLGCWDGYWSFYAERRGAARVLASDDQTQNWAKSSGLLLAKELLGSGVMPRLDVSVYEAGKLNETFDVILCLGIHYHLVDPFLAFAQLRHCCHPNSIVVVEGDISEGTRANMPFYDLSNPELSVFVPTRRVLEQMLGASYFEVVSQVLLLPPAKLSWRRRLEKARRIYRDTVREKVDRYAPGLNRAVTICRPFTGHNKFHLYRPPFALHQYDDRFCS